MERFTREVLITKRSYYTRPLKQSLLTSEVMYFSRQYNVTRINGSRDNGVDFVRLSTLRSRIAVDKVCLRIFSLFDGRNI